MTGGISLPCPVYKYRGKQWCENFGVCAGTSGFTVARHVHIHLKSSWITTLAWMIKAIVVTWFIIHSFYQEKAYLKFAHTQGISRMQLQHPVKSCNPLTQKEGGCATDFKKVEDLPYCKQSGVSGKDGEAIKKETCEYFDEFDVQLPGYQQSSLMIPTRLTKYVQDVDCSKKPLGVPCPRKDQLKPSETVYVADIEDFTLLIDHSFVNDEVGCEKSAWEMLGFFNPCGWGTELESGGLHAKLMGVKQMVSGVAGEEKECEVKNYMPIHRPKGHLSEEEQQKSRAREAGFAMWMSPWWQTFFPFLAADAKTLAYQNVAPILKIPNGDVIKIKDLLEFSHIDLDHVDESNRSNRHDGKVIIIDIHYTNWKEDSWPNKVDPAYFYSFSVAPADEFKLMQNSVRHLARRDPDAHREIYDYHGLFIIIKQSGNLGVVSFQHLFLLFLGVIFIESLYRSIFLCVILNFDLDRGKVGKDEGAASDSDIEGEIDDVVTKEFHLHGARRSLGPGRE